MELYKTYDEARTALDQAESDVIADMGEDAVDECWFDIVESVAQFCTPGVAGELRRTQGVG